MIMKNFIIKTIALILVPLACANAETRKVRCMVHWIPQSQFAGYYMAKELGFYAKRGLDVTILHPQKQQMVLDVLASGKIDFCTHFLMSAIEARGKGTDLVNIGQTSQQSALMLVCKAGSKINIPAELSGKRVAVWYSGFQAALKAFLRQVNVQAQIIPTTNEMELFINDGVDATTAMWYNEYDRLLDYGFKKDELKCFFFKDYDFNIPEDGIYCLREHYQRNPQTARDFVLATIEGWKAAFENEERALKIVKRYVTMAKLPFNPPHERSMLQKMKQLIFPDGAPTGVLKHTDYAKTALVLYEAGLIKSILPYEEFYVNIFKQKQDHDIQK